MLSPPPLSPPCTKADPVELTEDQQPSFSIRDYVFSSRNKCITNNWPFPPKLLQGYFKHGIRDVLPPFEAPGLVKYHICRKKTEFEQPVVITQSTFPVADDPSTSRYVDSIDKEADRVNDDVSSFPSRKLVVKWLNKRSPSFQKNRKAIIHDLDNRELKLVPILETLGEKSELVPKLIDRVEEASPTSSSTSDPMASKICPICGVFSSTSNTTLNAHIDQCLSMESNDTHAVDSLPHFKIKPIKKRLMVDIYAATPPSTLEDLDRRNGTNWFAEMNMLATSYNPEPVPPSQNNDFDMEAKRPKIHAEDIIDVENEGDVYVDSNGIKLRILSKFDDASMMLPRKGKLVKHAIDPKASKKLSISKKKIIWSRHRSNVQMDVQSKKSTLSEFTILDGRHSKQTNKHMEKEESECAKADICHHVEVQATNGLESMDDHLDGQLEQEQSDHQMVVECHKINGFEILAKWARSKRSALPRKLKKKFNLSENTIEVTTRNPLSESNEPILKEGISNSSKISTSFLKIKRIDLLDNPTERKIPINASLRPPGTYMRCLETNKESSMPTGMPSSSLVAKNHAFTKKYRNRRLLSNSANTSVFNDAHRVHEYTDYDDDDIDGRSGKSSQFDQSDIVSGHDISPRTAHGTTPYLNTSKTEEFGVEEGSQVDSMVSDDVGIQLAIDRANLDASKAETVILENSKRDAIARTSRPPSIEECVPMLGKMDIEVELPEQNVVSEQDTGHDDGYNMPTDTQSMELEERVFGDDFILARSTKDGAGTLTTREPTDKDIPNEKSTVTSAGAVPCTRREYGSPLSTSSTTFPSSELPLLRSPEKCRDLVIENLDNNTMKAPLFKDPQGYCSRNERLYKVADSNDISMTPTKPCIAPSFYTSSSVPSDMVASIPFLMSPRDSAGVPVFSNLSSPSPSPRTQTLLRLMGKNLMVCRDVEPAQLPATVSDHPSDRHFCTSEFCSTRNVLIRDDFSYYRYPRPPNVFNNQVPFMPCHMPVNNIYRCISNSSLNPIPDQRTLPQNLLRRYDLDHMPATHTEIAGGRPIMREFLSIDDSPEHVAAQTRTCIASPSCSIPPIPGFGAADALRAEPFFCHVPRKRPWP